MIDRLPPQSLEAEQSVLGALLIDRDAVIEVAEFLRPADFYRQANVKELQKQCFRASSFPELAMTPQQAYESLVANKVDYVSFDDIRGRISATLALIYPPGIGVIVPGERWDDSAKPMFEYFLAFEESFNRFPGFNYEVQGVYQELVNGRIKFHTYVVQE